MDKITNKLNYISLDKKEGVPHPDGFVGAAPMNQQIPSVNPNGFSPANVSPRGPGGPPMIPPEARLMQVATGYWTSQCLSVAIQLEIHECFRNGPRNIYEIAMEKNVNPDALYRTMRALSSIGIFMECEEDGLFNHSPTSKVLEDPNGYVNAIRLETNPKGYKCWSNYMESVKKGGPQAHVNFGKENMWDVMHEDREFSQIFDRAMGVFTKKFNIGIMKEVGHQFNQFDTVCDLGGSQGVLLKEILKNNSNIKKGICFDLPSVQLGSHEDSRYSEERGSFFESIPEADCYILKSVLHDWSDEKCTEILNNISNTMTKNGRIYVFDALIGPKNQPSVSVFMDIHMMHMFNGKERTLKQWNMLAKQSSLEVDLVRPITNNLGLVVMKKK